jgi:hypothetical protein
MDPIVQYSSHNELSFPQTKNALREVYGIFCCGAVPQDGMCRAVVASDSYAGYKYINRKAA